MPKYDYDLFVIGGGSGGVRSARLSTQLGAKVALCESDRLGGTCVIRGCIPKKLMVYGSEFPKFIKQAQAYGWSIGKMQLNWELFNQNRHKEIKRLETIYTNLLQKHSIKVISGKGILEDPHTVCVDNKKFTSRYILIAVGGVPHVLNIKGSEFAINSNDMFNLPKLPQSLLVLGAGYIALEFASIFNSLGTKVKVLFRGDSILRGFDNDVRKHLQQQMSHLGMGFVPSSTPVEIIKKDHTLQLIDDKQNTWEAEQILMATGRKPNTQSLNLEAIGVKTNKQGAIKVNDRWESTCPNIFAVGDCANTPYALTPTATAEGTLLSKLLFDKNTDKSTHNNALTKKEELYNNVPTAVFTQPPVATVGLTEEQALDKGFKVRVYESRFRPLKVTVTHEPEQSYMKLIVCNNTDKVIGCHIVGTMADEMLQGFAVAVKAGLTKKQWDQTIGIHPTSAEELVTLRTPRK